MPATSVDAGLAALLAGDNPPEMAGTQAQRGDPAGPESGQQDRTPAPESADAESPLAEPEKERLRTFRDLAAKAGFAPEEIWNLELDLPKNLGSIKLSDFKDRLTELKDLDATREVVESERASQRQDRLRWTQELKAASAAGLREFSEQERGQIGQLLQRHAEAEATTIMAAIPEWANAATLKADFEGMTELLKPYGFSPTDTAQALEGDARLTLFMKDQLDRSRRLKAAEAKLKTPPKKLQAPAGLAHKGDALERLYNDPKSSSIDRGLAALMMGTRK